MQYGTFVTVLVQESLLPGDASATYSVSFKSWKGTVRYSAPESTFCSLGAPTGARMVISVRLNMCLCKSRGRADQKPGEKKRCKSAEPHVFPPFSSEATLRARLFLGQEGDAATRGEARRSRGIQDVCVMLFDTWADCLCQTWRGAPFTVTVPWNGSSRKSSGRKKQREGMNSLLIPEMSVWRSCSTSINLFFISPRRSQGEGSWEVHLTTRGSSSAAPWGKRRSVSVCFSCSHEGHKWQKFFFSSKLQVQCGHQELQSFETCKPP